MDEINFSNIRFIVICVNTCSEVFYYSTDSRFSPKKSIQGMKGNIKIKGCHSTEVTRMSAFSKGGENQEKSSKLLFYQYHFFDIGKL